MTDRDGLIKEKLLNLLAAAKALPNWDRTADFLIASGVTIAADANVGPEWISVTEKMPDEFVSVLGHMTDAGPFPAVRECYLVGNVFFFPALKEVHPVDKWTEMPEPPKEV